MKITFSNTSKQVGILGATITKIVNADPTLAAEDVNLTYNAGGSLSYTLTNPKTDGKVTAETTFDWLNVGNPSNSNASGTVALTCAANTGAERTATVTLTYTYETNKTVEKEVTVTQAANPSFLCGGSVTITFSELYNNNDAFSSYTTPKEQGGYITLTGDKGTNSNGPKYYDTGSAVRFYGSNTLTVSTKNNTDLAITKVVMTFDSGESNNSISVDCGIYDNAGTWHGVNAPVKFTISGSSGHRRVKTVTVYYALKLTGEQTALNITSPYAIASGSTVTGTLSCANAANLVIADGGQLITSNAVQATVQKSITAWTTEPVGGWYFIASPLNASVAPGSVTNLVAETAANYDLYRLNPTTPKWENFKNAEHSSDFTTLDNGCGYLYANASNATLAFTGAIKPYSTSTNTVTLAKDGWNLIGNPFTCNVSVNKAFVELNHGEAVTSKAADNIINPCTGIAVYGNKDEEVTFTAVTPSMSAAPGNGSLNITVAEQVVNRGGVPTSSVLDNAIVSFNETEGLPKFNLLEGNAKLYIPQGAEEYAIVSAEACGELPVNFKAAKDGEYTLTVNAEGVEMNYLHLIDNLTGADTDLLATPSYTFNARTTDYASRFRLVFGANDENGASTSSATFAYVSNGQVVVNGTGILQVVDMLGRIVASQEVTTANCQLSTANY